MSNELVRLLAAIRPVFLSACDATARSGPFLCLVRFGPNGRSSLDVAGEEVYELALACLWPRKVFLLGEGKDRPLSRWHAASDPSGGPAEFWYAVDHGDRLGEFERLARQAFARLPAEAREGSAPVTDPNLPCRVGAEAETNELWCNFVFRALREAGLLRQRGILDGRARMFWYDADAFAASLAAIDLCVNGAIPAAELSTVLGCSAVRAVERGDNQNALQGRSIVPPAAHASGDAMRVGLDPSPLDSDGKPPVGEIRPSPLFCEASQIILGDRFEFPDLSPELAEALRAAEEVARLAEFHFASTSLPPLTGGVRGLMLTTLESGLANLTRLIRRKLGSASDPEVDYVQMMNLSHEANAALFQLRTAEKALSGWVKKAWSQDGGRIPSELLEPFRAAVELLRSVVARRPTWGQAMVGKAGATRNRAGRHHSESVPEVGKREADLSEGGGTPSNPAEHTDQSEKAVTNYDRLAARVIDLLTGDLLPPPSWNDLERHEQQIVIAVCEETGMTPTLWATLNNASREPWLDKTISALTKKAADRQPSGEAASPSPEVQLPRPDGVEGGCWLRWCGKRHDIPKGVVYRLIDFMWDRDSAPYDNLEGPVFEDAILPGTVRARVSEVNRVLKKIGVPWRLQADATSRILSKHIRS